jgi:hypothetical protein
VKSVATVRIVFKAEAFYPTAALTDWINYVETALHNYRGMVPQHACPEIVEASLLAPLPTVSK